MKSRTSFFNGTVLRKDITRFCPAWALYLVFLLMWAFSVFDYGSIWYGMEDIFESMTTFSIVNLIYGFIVASLLFGDLFKSRLCNGVHSLALRRESWFATHCLAGLLFSLVPNLILSVLIYSYSCSQIWFLGPLWLLAMTLQYLFFFGLGVFSVMCCGNRFAAATVYGLINFGSLIVYWFVTTFYEPLLYGVVISGTGFQLLCPSVQLLQFNIIHTNETIHHLMGYKAIIGGAGYHVISVEWYMFSLFILGLVFLGLALLLYRRRKLESAGDLMAFSWLRPIFAVVYTLTVGALFEMAGNTLIDQEYVFLAVGILVGYFTGQMLLQRTVSVFKIKTFLGCGAVGLALLISIGITALDPLGIVTWLPESKDVVSVSITDYRKLADGLYYDLPQETFSSPAMIDAVIDVQQLLVDARETKQEGYEYKLTYKMKDGREIKRTYYCSLNSKCYEQIQALYSMPEYVMGYRDWDTDLSSISRINVRGATFRDEAAFELLEAIRKDCEDGCYKPNKHGADIYATAIIYTEDGAAITVRIYYNCYYSSQWLREHFPPTSSIIIYD